jgi:hypothetical protein
VKRLTGGKRYRCSSISQGGYGRSLFSEIVILELEEQDDDTGDISWRYATYADVSATEDVKPND